jgi:retinol dehydrogenase 12
MGFLTSFFYSQLFVSLPKPTTPFTGKTVIVTGANTGLGFEAAKHIVGLNAKKVILACRNLQKGEAARQVIEDSTGRKNVVEVWHLDLDLYDSVKKFAARAGSELSRLDAVIENAGIMTSAFRLAEENESTITVNVISTFLLAMLLLPQLHKTQQKYGVETTLTIVASELHWVAKFPERESAPGEIFNTLNDKAMAQMGDRCVFLLSEPQSILTPRPPSHPYSMVSPGLTISLHFSGADTPSPNCSRFSWSNT